MKGKEFLARVAEVEAIQKRINHGEALTPDEQKLARENSLKGPTAGKDYFDVIGEEIEKHPIGRRRPRGTFVTD